MYDMNRQTRDIIHRKTDQQINRHGSDVLDSKADRQTDIQTDS